MKAIRGFFKLSPGDRLIFIRAYFLCACISILVEIISFKRLAGRLGKHMEETPKDINPKSEKIALQTGRLILKATRYIPWKIKCLTQAATGKLILRKLGIASTLYLGVKKSESTKLEAHAWLRVGNEIVTGKAVHQEFTIVSYFGE